MRIVLQRVARAAVTVGGDRVAAIGPGLLLLVAIGDGDAADEVERMAEKVANLRIFADDAGKMNLDLADAGGEVLVVSQFTLYGDVRKVADRRGPVPRRGTSPPSGWRRSPSRSRRAVSGSAGASSARTWRWNC
jgi:D-tyrosyl-tRNA(Tyr) deacylase